MAKQLINFSPAFVPGVANQGYLDFSGMDPEFDISSLYAVINVTRNVVMYAPGAAGMGGTTTSTNFGTTTAYPAQTDAVLTLSMDTSSYAATDVLNVIYDVPAGRQGPGGSNMPVERGGMLEAHYILLAQILTELRVQNEILLEGLMGRNGVGRESVDDYRNEQTTPATFLTNSGVGS
jgi:hypothetical protein